MSEWGSVLKSLPEIDIDVKNMTATFLDEEDEEHTVHLEYEVCGTCSGKGNHVNPSIDAHGITPEEFAEDPGFREDYFSGVYDVTCYECKGQRVVLTVNEAETAKATLKVIEDHARYEFAYRQECEFERKMGC